ncbi:hypothetical protein WICMUC_000193 [Wickerhamomyces mucosus]|uniref:EKC/KEOPS complex subunit GON7 n=1 Tax=Wickerhamomyces mucosus TaxID=1378264 RepID=A0A9P8PYF5_9ASCO|nr:hypothetical protein WICMUC_000193 [Wickerhamomyces mucosus]
MPSAQYISPDQELLFKTNQLDTSQLSTIGITSGPSEYVKIDRDQPSEAKDTFYGKLRCKITNLQDQLNIFLTEQMGKEKNDKDIVELEKKLLDGNDDE